MSMDKMSMASQRLLDVAEVILLALDPGGRVGLINRKGCEVVGYAEGDLIGRNWFDLCVPPENREAVSAVFRSIMRGELKLSADFESTILRSDGSLRTIAWHNDILREEDGRISVCLCSGEDITERRRTEEALRISEAKYRTLAEDYVDIPYQMDADGTLTYVGPQVARYGFDPDDIVSHNMGEFLHPEDEEQAIELLRQALATGSEFCERYRVIDNRGQVVWLEAKGCAQRDDGGRVRGITGILRDVTERAQVEDVLRESEDRFRRIFEEGPIGMTLAGADFRFLQANAAFCRMIGRREEDLTLLTFREITHPEDVGSDAEEIGRLMAGAIPSYKAEKRYLRPSGEVVWGFLTLSICRDSEGKFLYFLALVEDITARKAAELAVQVIEQRYRQMVDSSNDWIWEVDAAGVYTYASARVREQLGYDPEEIIGKTPWDLMLPDEAARVGPIFGAIAAERLEFRRLVNTNVHKDGHHVVLETNGIPWFDAGGRYCGYRGLDRDITQRKQTEEALRSALRIQRRLAGIVEASEDAIFWVSMDAVVQSWNGGAERMLGYAAGEIVGRPVALLIPAEHRRRIEDGFSALESGRKLDIPETEIVRKDGKQISASMRGCCIVDDEVSMCGIFIRELNRTNRTAADRLAAS